MLLKRWEPFSELRRFENRMDRMWRGFGNRSFVDIPATERWSIPLDVVRDGEKITVNASLPGVKPEDIEVTETDRRGPTDYQRPHGDRARIRGYCPFDAGAQVWFLLSGTAVARLGEHR